MPTHHLTCVTCALLLILCPTMCQGPLKQDNLIHNQVPRSTLTYCHVRLNMTRKWDLMTLYLLHLHKKVHLNQKLNLLTLSLLHLLKRSFQTFYTLIVIWEEQSGEANLEKTALQRGQKIVRIAVQVRRQELSILICRGFLTSTSLTMTLVRGHPVDLDLQVGTRIPMHCGGKTSRLTSVMMRMTPLVKESDSCHRTT